jgi:hypothetical protein
VLAAEDGEEEQEESPEVTWACTCGKPPLALGDSSPCTGITFSAFPSPSVFSTSEVWHADIVANTNNAWPPLAARGAGVGGLVSLLWSRQCSPLICWAFLFVTWQGVYLRQAAPRLWGVRASAVDKVMQQERSMDNRVSLLVAIDGTWPTMVWSRKWSQLELSAHVTLTPCVPALCTRDARSQSLGRARLRNFPVCLRVLHLKRVASQHCCRAL